LWIIVITSYYIIILINDNENGKILRQYSYYCRLRENYYPH